MGELSKSVPIIYSLSRVGGTEIRQAGTDKVLWYDGIGSMSDEFNFTWKDHIRHIYNAGVAAGIESGQKAIIHD